MAAYVLIVTALFFGCYLVFEAYGLAKIDLERLLLIKIALIIVVSGVFVRFRALRWSQRNEGIARDLARSRVELVERLARAAEYRDDATGLHNRRIGLYAGVVAHRLGLDAATREALVYASVLHDVGKIGVSDAVLLKAGPLDAAERAAMELHTSIGGALLAESGDALVDTAQRIALAHHENWDGTGYPHGLRGESIPLEARIVAVCDVFDALTSVRPYKEAWPVVRALEEIRSLAGSKFDPEVAAAFLAAEDEVRRIAVSSGDGATLQPRLLEVDAVPCGMGHPA